MRDIATLSAPQNPWGVDGQILTPWKLSHARRARHVPMPIGSSSAGLPPHSRRYNPQKWLVPLYRMTTCACGSGQHSPSPWPRSATQVQWRLLPCARTRLCTWGGAEPPPTTMQCAGLCSASPASIDTHRLVWEPQLRNRGMPSSAAPLATHSLRRRGPGHACLCPRPTAVWGAGPGAAPRGAVSRIERAARLRSGLAPTTGFGRVRRDPQRLSWSEAGGLETCLRPWVMHHQHSRDTRNDCVKSPQDGRRCLDPWTEFQPFLIA